MVTKIVNYSISLASMALTVVILMHIYSSILKPRFKTYKIFLVIFLVNLIHNILKNLGIINQVIVCFTFFIYAIFFVSVLYKGRFFDRLLAFIISCVSQLISETMCIAIASGLMDFTYEDVVGMSFKKNILLILGTINFAIIAELIIFVQRPISKYVLDKSVLPVLIAFIMQAILFVIYCYLFMTILKLSTNPIFWIYACLIILVDLLVVQAILELLYIRQSKDNLNYIRGKEQVHQDYYIYLCRNVNSISERKMEYESKLQQVYKLVGKNTDYENNSRGDKENKTENTESIDNTDSNITYVILNDIVAGRKTELDSLNCKYNIDITRYQNTDINILDASSLLVNMLDNAIEAVRAYVQDSHENTKELIHNTKKSGNDGKPELLRKNHVYVLSGEENGKMFLEVGNVKRARQKIVEIKGKYGTTKENKEGHGYGMEIIREIAEKYNGKMEVRYAKDYFVNRVWISLE
jgi:hypothetical protein